MANETQNTAKEKKGSLAPFVIIALLFVVTIAGVYFIVQSGEETAGGSANADGNGAGNSGSSSEPQPLPNYATAPPGAIPPHFKGSESSPVIVEEFADFQCPTCALVHPRMNEITSRFGSRIKFVFRNYPLTNLHPNAYNASVAAEAAGLQGKFWDMQNLIFSNQAQWSNSQEARRMFEDYAKRLGLDVEKFSNDMLGVAAKRRVDEDMRRARALNITGTPSILVNGKPVNSFEVNVIGSFIEKELERFAPKKEQAEGSNSNAGNGSVETEQK